jgi:hypothetical protein
MQMYADGQHTAKEAVKFYKEMVKSKVDVVI